MFVGVVLGSASSLMGAINPIIPVLALSLVQTFKRNRTIHIRDLSSGASTPPMVDGLSCGLADSSHRPLEGKYLL